MIHISRSTTQTLLLSTLVNPNDLVIALAIDEGVSVSIHNDTPLQSITCTVQDYAQLSFVHLANHALDSVTIEYTIHLGYKSVVTHTVVVSGVQESCIAVHVILNKPLACANLFGAYALVGNQTTKIATTQEHRAPNTISTLVYKGLLAGTAHAEYNGLITIEQNATGSDASQQNKNLLLQSGARATSIPSLQALTNNIQCRHGSAVGHLDAEHLWYLQSRGISHSDAKQMLIKAFLVDALHGVTNNALHNATQQHIVDTLANAQGVMI